MDVKLLASSDAHILRTFECTLRPRSWEQVIDEIVRVHLPDILVSGQLHTAAGGWVRGEMIAVGAWIPAEGRSDTWICNPIAVRSGHHRKGHGQAMKRWIANQARAAGVQFLQSTVHRDNRASLAMNERLGAMIEPIRGDPNYLSVVLRTGA